MDVRLCRIVFDARMDFAHQRTLSTKAKPKLPFESHNLKIKEAPCLPDPFRWDE
jgi:hypothetical protein